MLQQVKEAIIQTNNNNENNNKKYTFQRNGKNFRRGQINNIV